MKLFRTDYDTIDGKLVKVRKDELYLWAPVNTETGEVNLGYIKQFNDGLHELMEPLAWKRFTLTLSEEQSC